MKKEMCRGGKSHAAAFFEGDKCRIDEGWLSKGCNINSHVPVASDVGLLWTQALDRGRGTMGRALELERQ